MTFTSCTSNSQSDFPGEANNKTIHTLKDSIYYTLFHTEKHAYGFDVIKNGKVYIHQPLVPCWQGLQHFASEQDAVTVAKFIVNKLRTKNFKFLLQKFEIDSLMGSGKKHDNVTYKLPVQDTNMILLTQNDISNIPGISSEIIPLPNPPIKNKWTAKENVPFGYRGGGFSFAIGKLVYIGSGECYDEIIKDFWCYNTNDETWTCLAEVPIKCFSGIALSIFNKGYVGLGTEIGTSSGKFEKHMCMYDPEINSWKMINNFPGTPRIDAAVFVIQNKAYAGTGYDGTNTKDFYEYDPKKDNWKRIADFAGGTLHASIGIGTGKRGFIVAGARAPNDFKFVYEYIPALNKWERRQDLPGYARNFLTGNYIDENYLIAGSGGTYEINKRLKDFYIYNTETNTWSNIPDYPIGPLGDSRPCGANVDGKVYMGTGFNGTFLNDWNVFERYFSVRKDTGMYDEGIGYPLKYNGSWELYQECTGEDCFAGISIRSKEQLGNFGYASHYATLGKEVSLLNDKYFVLPRSFAIQTQKQPEQKVGIRLFFTRDERLDAMSTYQKKTGLLFSPENIKILQCNEKTPDCSIDNNHFQKTSSQLLRPVWYQYGANGETIVAEFTTTVIQSEFYAVISSVK